MSDRGRLLLHVPVGLLAMVLFWLSPLAGIGFVFMFWFYEANEDGHTWDQAWKDTSGMLWGMAVGGIIWAMIKLFGGQK